MVWTQGYQLFVLCDHHLGHPLLDWGDDYHSGVVESPTSLSEDHSQLDDHTRQTTILYCRIQVKVIFTVLKDLKQLQKKSRKNLRLQQDLNPWPPQYQCNVLQLWSFVESKARASSILRRECSYLYHMHMNYTVLYGLSFSVYAHVKTIAPFLSKIGYRTACQTPWVVWSLGNWSTKGRTKTCSGGDFCTAFMLKLLRF